MDRTVEEAIDNGERLRREMPYLIQPSHTDVDMVVLVDEIERLRGDLSETRIALANCECRLRVAKAKVT